MKYNDKLSITLSKSQLELIDRAAHISGKNRSQFIRDALTAYLDDMWELWVELDDTKASDYEDILRAIQEHNNG